MATALLVFLESRMKYTVIIGGYRTPPAGPTFRTSTALRKKKKSDSSAAKGGFGKVTPISRPKRYRLGSAPSLRYGVKWTSKVGPGVVR